MSLFNVDWLWLAGEGDERRRTASEPAVRRGREPAPAAWPQANSKRPRPGTRGRATYRALTDKADVVELERERLPSADAQGEGAEMLRRRFMAELRSDQGGEMRKYLGFIEGADFRGDGDAVLMGLRLCQQPVGIAFLLRRGNAVFLDANMLNSYGGGAVAEIFVNLITMAIVQLFNAWGKMLKGWFPEPFTMLAPLAAFSPHLQILKTALGQLQWEVGLQFLEVQAQFSRECAASESAARALDWKERLWAKRGPLNTEQLLGEVNKIFAAMGNGEHRSLADPVKRRHGPTCFLELEPFEWEEVRDDRRLTVENVSDRTKHANLLLPLQVRLWLPHHEAQGRLWADAALGGAHCDPSEMAWHGDEGCYKAELDLDLAGLDLQALFSSSSLAVNCRRGQGKGEHILSLTKRLGRKALRSS